MNIDFEIDSFKIGVVGAGSWGTALANLLAVKGFVVDHWVFESEVLNQIKQLGENKRFLPGFKLSSNLCPSDDLKKTISNKDMVVLVTPSHVMRSIVKRFSNFLSFKTILVSASKGIENVTNLTMSGVLKSVLPQLSDSCIAVLTGPSFAKEVIQRIPTAVTVASKDYQIASFVQRIFATDYFRVYTITDVIGAELGASVKNVIAIASGIVDGLGLGFNTRAALITRGLTEIRRLGLAMGANPRTFTGLAGVGDLILTCTSELSRNYTVGRQVGQGRKLYDLVSETSMVVEGVRTSKSIYNLSNELKVEMPISNAIYGILHKNLDPSEAVYNLMTRGLKREMDIK